MVDLRTLPDTANRRIKVPEEVALRSVAEALIVRKVIIAGRGRPVPTAHSCCLQWVNNEWTTQLRRVGDPLEFLEGWQSPVGKGI